MVDPATPSKLRQHQLLHGNRPWLWGSQRLALPSPESGFCVERGTDDWLLLPWFWAGNCANFLVEVYTYRCFMDGPMISYAWSETHHVSAPCVYMLVIGFAGNQ